MQTLNWCVCVYILRYLKIHESLYLHGTPGNIMVHDHGSK